MLKKIWLSLAVVGAFFVQARAKNDKQQIVSRVNNVRRQLHKIDSPALNKTLEIPADKLKKDWVNWPNWGNWANWNNWNNWRNWNNWNNWGNWGNF